MTPADDAFLTNFCTVIEDCCVRNIPISRAPDVAGCKRQYTMVGFSRDPALQAMCLAEVQGLATRAGAGCLPEVWNLSGACQRLFYEPSGTVAPGQPCMTRSDCAGEPGTVTFCLGVCVRMARGKAGDTTCLGDMSNEGTITAAPAYQVDPLPPITTGVLCARRDGLYCTANTDHAQQTCAPLRAGGVPCDFSSTCQSGNCYNRICDTIVPAGQTCSGDVAPRTICDATSRCTSDGVTSGTCVAGLPGGAACDFTTFCANGNCQNGTCKSTTDLQDISIFGYCSRLP